MIIFKNNSIAKNFIITFSVLFFLDLFILFVYKYFNLEDSLEFEYFILPYCIVTPVYLIYKYYFKIANQLKFNSFKNLIYVGFNVFLFCLIRISIVEYDQYFNISFFYILEMLVINFIRYFIIFIIALNLISRKIIFKDFGYNNWKFILPIWGEIKMIDLLKLNNTWKYLLFIPFINIIIHYNILRSLSEKYLMGGTFQIGLFLFPFIYFPKLAFRKNK